MIFQNNNGVKPLMHHQWLCLILKLALWMPSEQYCPLPPFAAVAFIWVRQCTVRSATSVWHRHIKMMQKLGSGRSTSSDFHFYRRTKLAMHLLTSWLTLPRTHRAKPSLTICWTPMSLRTAAFLQLYGRRHPLLRSYREQIMAVNLLIYTSVRHFRDLIPTFIIFRTLFCCTNRMRSLHSAAEHLVSKTSEETGRNPKGLHKNLGFVYNRPNQSQRLHRQNVLQVFTSTLVVGSYIEL